jgi:protein involved in polysaccharide export with SLBB domain
MKKVHTAFAAVVMVTALLGGLGPGVAWGQEAGSGLFGATSGADTTPSIDTSAMPGSGNAASSFGSSANSMAPSTSAAPAAAQGSLPALSNGQQSALSQLLTGSQQTLTTGRARTMPAAGDVQTAAAPLPLPPEPMNDFQKFVQTSTGESLPIFGSALFSDIPTSYAPVQDTPATPDYAVGPGDELMIRVWGSIDFTLNADVDRTGQITIPKVGTFSVAGIKAGDLNAFIKSKIGAVYRDFDADVTLGYMRSIQVYVVGNARRPGTYTLSSLSTLVNAVFASGGPSNIGSMRHIELKRHGVLVADFDLYDFINHGNSAADAHLQSGDVIFIPPVGPSVALLGTVNTPAIYELKKPDSTVAELLAWSGGLPITANTRQASLERIQPGAATARSATQIVLDSAGQAMHLRNGDVLRVSAISPKIGEVVTLRGNVASPMRVPFVAGMRIRDLIPNRDALIVPGYYQRANGLTLQNAAAPQSIVERVRNSADEVNWDYAVIERLDPKTLQTHLIPFNLGRVILQDDETDNLALEPGDVVTIFSKSDMPIPQDKQTRLVTVSGEVNAAGVYQLTPGETLREAIRRAGGITPQAYLFGTTFTRAETQRMQQQNLDEALNRLETKLQSRSAKQLANLNGTSDDRATQAAALQQEEAQQQQEIDRIKTLRANGRIALELSPDASTVANLPDVPLEDGDTINIPTRGDFVMAVGAVNNDNAILWKPGRTVGDLLSRAGPTDIADTDNAFVLRADGTVISGKETGSGWLSFGKSFANLPLMPADTLFVPEELDQRSAYTQFMSGFKDWTQVIYQLGLGIAAFKALGL